VIGFRANIGLGLANALHKVAATTPLSTAAANGSPL